MKRLPDLENIEHRIEATAGVICSLCENCKSDRVEIATGVLYAPRDFSVQYCAVFADAPINVHPTSIDFLFTDEEVYNVEFESISSCGRWLSFQIKWSADLDAVDLDVD